MGSFSWWHWLIVLLVILLLFGGGKKIPELFKGLGTGIKGFKKAMREDEDELDTAQPLANTKPQKLADSSAQADSAALSAVAQQAPQVVQIEVSAPAVKKPRARKKLDETSAESMPKKISAQKNSVKKASASKSTKSSTESKSTKSTKSAKSASKSSKTTKPKAAKKETK
nr:twin-arginine translocase TatA/TatE family subunit [uncultured Helicobacter sp.]